MTLPRIAVTMGDPAGIGPEIVAKLFATGVGDAARAFVVGDVRALRAAAALAGAAVDARAVETPGEAPPGVVEVVQVGEPLHDVVPGRVDARAGAAAYAYVTHAIALAQAGKADAIVTAPINKESLALAGAPHHGHTRPWPTSRTRPTP